MFGVEKSSFETAGTAGAFMAFGRVDEPLIKKPQQDENPLSNANLPGGLFTHPGVC